MIIRVLLSLSYLIFILFHKEKAKGEKIEVDANNDPPLRALGFTALAVRCPAPASQVSLHTGSP